MLGGGCGGGGMQTRDPSDYFLVRCFRHACLSHCQPVSKYDNPLSQPKHMFKVVTNDHDAESLVGEALDEAKDFELLGYTKVVGRLIQQDELSSPGHPPRDGYRLPLSP